MAIHKRKMSSDSDSEAEVGLLLQEVEIEEPGDLVRSLRSRKHFLCFRKTTCYYLILFVVVILGLLAVNSRGPKRNGMAIAEDGPSPPWYPSPFGGNSHLWIQSYKKAKILVDQMTLAEKVNITTGTGWMMGLCVGNTGSVARLSFPSLCLQDGPLGIRYTENITAFPAGLTIAATWDHDLFRRRGQALGAEALAKGVNVLLGPAMGPIGRSPLGGRNWEGFGADPYLQGIAAAATITGIQGEGVIATAKHFVGNEQEHFRIGGEWGVDESISVEIDDRTLHELYGWPFQDSVRAGVGSVMCSYNRVNESYACQNSKLMNGVLKDELGFQGFVVSDWLATHSGVASTLAGLDMNMPGDAYAFNDGDSFFGPKLTQAVLNGSVPIERINDMALRIVATWYQLGQDTQTSLIDGPNFSSWTSDETGPLYPASDDHTLHVVNKYVDAASSGKEDHVALARKIAGDSIVLLKNDGMLPLEPDLSKQRTASGKDITKVGVFGHSAFLDPDGVNACPERACINWAIGSGWGSGAVDFPYLVAPFSGLKEIFDDQPAVEMTSYVNEHLYDDGDIAAQDMCFVFLVANAGEGFKSAWEGFTQVRGDRPDLFAQRKGDDMVERVARYCNGDVIVVIHSVGPIIMERWIDEPKVKAVLMGHMPGQENGHGLTDVLFGKINPGGKLPYTIGKTFEDYGEAAKILDDVPRNTLPTQTFSEGFLIDYRHFDHYGITPRFEFGYGLSYSTFDLQNVNIVQQTKKSLHPARRPPPLEDRPIPISKQENPKDSLPPKGFKRLYHYIYSFLPNLKSTKYVEPPQVPAPALSPAGGAQGGNPSLFEVMLTIQATVLNQGSVPGSTVAQLYVKWPESYLDDDTDLPVQFPVRTLRGFRKIYLEPNESGQVTFELTRRDLSYWSTYRQNWVMPAQPLTIDVGFSSRDIKASVVY